VPYRTVVHARVAEGNQTFSGITGPIQAVAGRGNIRASYIAQEVRAQAESGRLEFQVVGGRVAATTGTGDNSCVRLPQGVTAETGNGDITLSVVGSSTATIKMGSGRVDVQGAQGSLELTTHDGGVHVKAEPHGDWRLNSKAGNLRIELPASAPFAIDASTDSGQVQLDGDGLHARDSSNQKSYQTVNEPKAIATTSPHSSPHIVAKTMDGNIVIAQSK
jgi:DUF4097 and DUF4098 domain-containing protein YvlB